MGREGRKEGRRGKERGSAREGEAVQQRKREIERQGEGDGQRHKIRELGRFCTLNFYRILDSQQHSWPRIHRLGPTSLSLPPSPSPLSLSVLLAPSASGFLDYFCAIYGSVSFEINCPESFINTIGTSEKKCAVAVLRLAEGYGEG